MHIHHASTHFGFVGFIHECFGQSAFTLQITMMSNNNIRLLVIVCIWNKRKFKWFEDMTYANGKQNQKESEKETLSKHKRT